MALDCRGLRTLGLHLGQPGKQFNELKLLEKPDHLVPVIVAYLAGLQVQLDGNIFDYGGQLFTLEDLSAIFRSAFCNLVGVISPMWS